MKFYEMMLKLLMAVNLLGTNGIRLNIQRRLTQRLSMSSVDAQLAASTAPTGVTVLR